jgi:all-trans-retinol 13,14-reductase
MEKYDIIIIGAGLGGLTAGAKLSKEGKKVLLIEQHEIPGGCATTFRRRNYKVEVGLNELGGLDEEDIKYRIFNELGVFKNVKFIRIPEFYRYAGADLKITVPDDDLEAIELFCKNFPKEKKGIIKFFKRILKIRREINRFSALSPTLQSLILPIIPFIFPSIAFNMNKTLGGFLGKCIKNEQLKACIAANIAYYHDDPNTMSLLFFSVAQGGFYRGGSYYIRGGSQELSNYLSSVICSNGGKILFNNLATKIIIENSKAIGVEYKPKNDPDKSINRAYAKYVIANSAIPNVAEKLLSGKEALKLKNKIAGLENSCSFFVVFLVFKKPLKDIGNKHYITFVNTEPFFKLSEWKKLHNDDYSKRPFFFCDYSQIDAKLADNGIAQGVICSTDYISNWQNLSIDEYRVKKEKCAQEFLDQLEKVIPGVKDNVDYYEIGTPKTLERYILTPGGSVYGFAQTVRQAVPRRMAVKSPIKNLFFASAWSFPGGGFTGAIMSGYQCARSIKN